MTALCFEDTEEGRRAKAIAPLAGMAYYSGYYTADEWLAKTGTDPRRFKEIDCNGLCKWTDAAERLYRKRIKAIKTIQAQLGI